MPRSLNEIYEALRDFWVYDDKDEIFGCCALHVVGWEDFTAEEASAVGHRVLTLERIFNMAHGLTADDDIKVSPRLTDPAPADAGPAAGKSIAPYLEGWVRDYYEHLGWDRKTGKPMRSTLKKLGLEEYLPLVWG